MRNMTNNDDTETSPTINKNLNCGVRLFTVLFFVFQLAATFIALVDSPVIRQVRGVSSERPPYIQATMDGQWSTL